MDACVIFVGYHIAGAYKYKGVDVELTYSTFGQVVDRLQTVIAVYHISETNCCVPSTEYTNIRYTPGFDT